MKRFAYLLAVLLFATPLFAQRRLGLTATYDYAYNTADKLMKPSIGRKFTIGVNFADRNKNLVGFVAAGFKGFKVNLYSPQFQQRFFDEVNANYHPVTNDLHDSLVASSMFHLANNEQGFSMQGTYSLHLQAGVLWNSNFLRPLILFYYGSEQYVFWTPVFYNSENFRESISMNANFYEIKAGIGLPFLRDKPWAVNLNIGYRHIDYRNISFDGTPLSVYTDGNIADKYTQNDKLTFSFSIIWWSNWYNSDKTSTPRDL